jgi:hypothetical protein
MKYRKLLMKQWLILKKKPQKLIGQNNCYKFKFKEAEQIISYADPAHQESSPRQP